jgi:hypothetical protein
VRGRRSVRKSLAEETKGMEEYQGEDSGQFE